MSKKQIDVYRTGKYLRLSQGDEDIDGWDKQESNSISNQKLNLQSGMNMWTMRYREPTLTDHPLSE